MDADRKVGKLILKVGDVLDGYVDLRLMDQQNNPAVDIRFEKPVSMGQNQWSISMFIEVGDIVISHDFVGWF